MREDSSGCNIKRDLVDRVQPGIGTKKPQAMRFSQGLGTSGLAGAEGLEPSARGFGVDVGTNHRSGVRPVSPGSCRKSQNGRCWFGAAWKNPAAESVERPGKGLVHIVSHEIVRRAGRYVVERLYPLAVNGGRVWVSHARPKMHRIIPGAPLSEARDKFLQVGKGFASFPGVLAFISFLQTSTHNEQRETFHRLNTLRLWYSPAYPPPRANSSS